MYTVQSLTKARAPAGIDEDEDEEELADNEEEEGLSLVFLSFFRSRLTSFSSSLRCFRFLTLLRLAFSSEGSTLSIFLVYVVSSALITAKVLLKQLRQ